MSETFKSPWDDLENWVNQPRNKPIYGFWYQGVYYNKENAHELPEEVKALVSDHQPPVET